jgi:hypothetical protein
MSEECLLVSVTKRLPPNDWNYVTFVMEADVAPFVTKPAIVELAPVASVLAPVSIATGQVRQIDKM